MIVILQTHTHIYNLESGSFWVFFQGLSDTKISHDFFTSTENSRELFKRVNILFTV